ncbi:hypothetical protein MUK70_08240 [Dyadobacter chenwenxiniae]|uniref:Uncharacterized protein n=1 Tax=Dyadobacter chenwenxiniae TaxID=2906456 RepID=A0A9X1PNL5_9BACT|nr:hypothetical protein [Dyadobacter chenwenxiniae]MCF0052142.1 hypothetical protein [Dyadobacter chenwenxiniae]MCF0062853.1 hypothetical protein [Dyadobacter chenwenxiniae]UON84972.1 hypothetical protein MUK70_08240 [Dyadobacter chenwenxiniae]
MKQLVLVVFTLIFLACKDKDADKVPLGSEGCLLTSYVTDTTGSGAKMEINYNKQNLITGTTYAYTGYFGDTTKITSTISYYYNEEKPSAISNSDNENVIRFEYADNGLLSSKTWYEKKTLPRQRVNVEWANGNMARVKRSLFERTGNADDPKSYVEKEYDRIELEIDAKGNLVTLKRYSPKSELITVNEYQYDNNPNPFKRLYTIQGAFFDDQEHLLSTNNRTKVTITYPANGKVTVLDYTFKYDAGGYPKDGFYSNRRALDMQYKCR